MSALRGLAVTAAGRNLFAKLAAAGKPLKLSRIMFGTGKLPEGSTNADMASRTGLVSPFAEGTSTTPIYENDTVSMVLEFRSDMNGGLKNTVWLNEYGVYANDPDSGEVLILYGNLGDYADSVLAYQKGVITTRDYPISVVIGAVSDVKLEFAASAFLTSQEADDILQACFRRAVSLTTIGVRIPPSAWAADESGGCFLYAARIENAEISALHYPDMALDPECFEDAFSYGLSPSLEAVDGALVFHAQERPLTVLSGVCRLLKKGMEPSGSGGAQTEAEPSCRHYVLAVRTRNPDKPDYGLGAGAGTRATLFVGPYTGKSEVGAIVNGELYDAENISSNEINVPDGTLIIKQMEV